MLPLADCAPGDEESEPMYVYPPPVPVYRPEKNYLGEAILSLVLYYLGFGIIGLIANIIFLNNARRDERMGIITHNAGCLQILLWVHIVLIVVGCIATIVFLSLGGLATIAGLWGQT
jgi:hypothetical protein